MSLTRLPHPYQLHFDWVPLLMSLSFLHPAEMTCPYCCRSIPNGIRPLEDISGGDYTDKEEMTIMFSLAMSADIADLIQLRGGYKFGPTDTAGQSWVRYQHRTGDGKLRNGSVFHRLWDGTFNWGSILFLI